MEKETIEQLYGKFELKQRSGYGGTYDYVPSDDIIDRMNKVFDGVWTSEVMSKEIIEEAVLMRVRVSAYDKVVERFINHDGFGSSEIARHKAGPHVGKVINIGNSFKSAESMAIRNACTRFGVGLYLKEDETGQEIPMAKEYGVPSKAETKTIEKETPKPVATSMPKMPKATSKLPPVASVPPPPPPPSPEAEKVEEAPMESPKVEEKTTLPKFPKFPSSNGSGGTATNKMPSIPLNNKPIEASLSPKGVEKMISDVQRTALEGRLEMNGIAFEDLIKSTFEFNGLDTDTLPASLSDLTYQEAMLALKYGNEAARKA
jgi:hypothetical protein